MGLPLVTLCAKLKLLSLSSHTRAASPFLISFLCPYLVKLACSLRVVQRAYEDLIYASRLFIFQLGRITFDDNGDEQQQFFGVGNRWGRAIRLICQRIALVRRSPTSATQSDEDSFHALSMFSL